MNGRVDCRSDSICYLCAWCRTTGPTIKEKSMTKQFATLAAALAFAMASGIAGAGANPLTNTGMSVGDLGVQLAQYDDPYDDEGEPDGGGYGGGGGGYGGGGGGYGGGRISCPRGRRIVERSGFYRVVPRDCGGRNYTYSAFRKGRPWIVRLNSFNGRIIATRPGY
jgi:hypothetical protein